MVTPSQRTIARTGPALLPLCAVVVLLCVAAGFGASLADKGILEVLQSVSSKVRDLQIDAAATAALALGVLLLVGLTAWLFVRHHVWFLVVLILSFSLSEITISGLNYASLFMRYVCMLLLIAAGILRLFGRRGSVGIVELLGLLLLAWMVISCLQSSAAAEALTLLPAYAAMFVGAFLGMRDRYRNPQEVSRLAGALVICGVLLTLLHLSALVLAPQPFLNGRFTSYHVLPTNFSNNYVIVVVAMLWYAMNGRKLLPRVIVGGCAFAGLALIVLSGTRNALAVSAICMVCFALTARARGLYLGLLGLMLVVAAGIYASGAGHEAVTVGGRLSDASFANRKDVWTLTWKEIDASPIVGHGLGTASALLGSKVEQWQQATYINTHNAYLGIWLQLGLIGLVPLLAIVAWTLWRGAVLCLALGGARGPPGAAVILPAVLFLGLAAAGIAEENLSGRGSAQQILWALSIAAVNGAYLARRTAAAARPALAGVARGREPSLA